MTINYYIKFACIAPYPCPVGKLKVFHTKINNKLVMISKEKAEIINTHENSSMIKCSSGAMK